MENTNVQEVKMPITYDDLKKSLVDSGRPYDFAMIDRAYALAEKAFDLWPSAYKVVDPVMGDNGKAYSTVTPAFIDRMRQLCRPAHPRQPCNGTGCKTPLPGDKTCDWTVHRRRFLL